MMDLRFVHQNESDAFFIYFSKITISLKDGNATLCCEEDLMSWIRLDICGFFTIVLPVPEQYFISTVIVKR